MWTPEEISRWKRNTEAMVRSAGAGDPEAFAELVALADWLSTDGLQSAYATQVAGGYSAADIARPLGISRQAAHKRFARR